jgi:heme-degrading monooxygenase HmoA
LFTVDEAKLSYRAPKAVCGGQRMIHQLRIYEIFENNKEAFHRRFRDHASRIMRSYGFDILATWETKNGDRTEFIYLLSWPDEKRMQHAWGQFRADEEWKKIKRDTNVQYGELVGEIQERTLQPVSQDMFVLQAST